MTEIQNRQNDSKTSDYLSRGFGHWNFDIIWNLSIVIWDLSAVSVKLNRFYLNHLGMALTSP
jgi:hypothetical protein